MAERTTKVRLSAEVQGYIEGMQKAARATRETGSETEKLAQQTEAIERLGRTMFVAGGSILAGLGMATKAAIDWDSAWAGVTKTVDGTPEQMRLVEQGLRDLTGVLPASHTEIAAVAEAAGQLGIQTPNLLAFTRTMIDLGETTNLTSTEAATQLARFMNVMGTSQDKVSNLGSALVELGNNYATTEAEILSMAQRLSGAGKQIGMSEGQIFGLSTALSSVGIEAEAGGSAMSKVMIDIASSVDKGGERVAMFADVAGVSAQEFSRQWKTDPGAALATFVKGLATAEAQGKSTFGVLEELGISEVRMRDALLRSASAADEFSAAMATGNSAFEDNNALSAEAEKRYETAAAKISIMGNKIQDFAISIGEKMLPLVEMASDGIGSMMDALNGLGGPMETVVAWSGLLIGTGILGAGVWLMAIPHIAKFKTSLEVLNLTGSRLTRTMAGIGKIAGSVTIWATLASIAGQTKADVTELTNAFERNADAQELMQKAAEANATRGLGGFTAQFQDITLSSQEVVNALQNQRKEWGDFWDYLGDATAQSKILEDQRALATFGNEMAKMADTDLAKLQSGLAGLASEFGFTRDDMWSFIENSPDLKSALEMQAGAFGLTTDKADMLKLAYGEVGPASEESGDLAADAASDYIAQADAAKAAAQELYALIDALMESNGVAQTAEGANARYQQSLADVAEYVTSAQQGLEGYSTSLDANTVEGSKNRDMLAGLAGDSQAAAYALMEQEAATLGTEQAAANYTQRLAEGRQALYDQILALTGNEEAATLLTDSLYKIPTETETQTIVDTAQANQNVAALDANIKAVPPRWFTQMDLDTTPATQKFNNWIAAHQGATVGINLGATGGGGNMVQRANGGIHEYANGGTYESGIYSGGAPLIKFAEPETRWESFISGKPSERDRNRQIWADTGARLGMSPGGGGVTQVSLAGASFAATIDGNPFTLMIGQQIDSAASAGGQSVRRGVTDRRFQ